MIKNLTVLIHSCGAYSDLWSGQIEMLNRHWRDRPRTIILTDANPNDYSFDGVEIFCAGDKKEITDRIASVLPEIDTEYVFVTLDDYYLLNDVDNERIKTLVGFMSENNYDYIRLFNDPNGGKKIGQGLFECIIKNKKNNYYVNLYQGIWRKTFIEKTLKPGLNAWQYEVSLTPTAIKENAKCAMTKGKEYKILDVIRKGKLLHKAKRYFKKDPVYTGNRPLLPMKEELRIKFRSFMKKILPRRFMQKIKKQMIKRGATFYSPLDE